MQGTQVIGWDAAQKRVRSWVFDSSGGFAEGLWTQDGERWIVKSNGTLVDGGKTSSVNIITRIDHNHLTWQSIGREVDGRLLPNIDPVTVVRQQ
jgi:hypothetical protein